jgi:hypothetical protein
MKLGKERRRPLLAGRRVARQIAPSIGRTAARLEGGALVFVAGTGVCAARLPQGEARLGRWLSEPERHR